MSAINYTRVNFQDYPTTTTPITAENLNKMDKGVYDLDQKLTTDETTLTNNGNDISTIKGDVSWYATSSTAAGTQAKLATTTDTKFSLVTGATVRVKFTNANTHESPTLNVDSKGAKSIKAYGTTAPTVWWKAGDIVEFTYDGTNWIMGASQGEIEQLNNSLTANSNHFYFDYHDGKYGYNTSANRGADTFVPFSSGEELVETLLWTNPGISLSAQTVTLSDDMTNYDYLKFVGKANGSTGRDIISIVPVDFFRTTTGSTAVYGWGCYLDGVRSRAIVYGGTDTTVKFGSGYTGQTSANGTLMATQIIGLKMDSPSKKDPVLLWTNPNLTSSWGEKSQTINYGTSSGYTHFLVEFKVSTDSSSIPNTFALIRLSTVDRSGSCYDGGGTWYFRPFRLSELSTSSTTFLFRQCGGWSDNTAYTNGRLIPYKIYGINITGLS